MDDLFERFVLIDKINPDAGEAREHPCSRGPVSKRSLKASATAFAKNVGAESAAGQTNPPLKRLSPCRRFADSLRRRAAYEMIAWSEASMRPLATSLICLFVLFCADLEFWDGRYAQGLMRLAESISRSFSH
jgi:hypothetical protein